MIGKYLVNGVAIAAALAFAVRYADEPGARAHDAAIEPPVGRCSLPGRSAWLAGSLRRSHRQRRRAGARRRPVVDRTATDADLPERLCDRVGRRDRDRAEIVEGQRQALGAREP